MCADGTYTADHVLCQACTGGQITINHMTCHTWTFYPVPAAGVTAASYSSGTFTVPSGTYCYYDFGSSLLGRTFSFGVNTNQLGNFMFCCNSTGSGQMMRVEGRTELTSTTGYYALSSWTGWSAQTGSYKSVLRNQWHTFSLSISGAGIASLTINGDVQSGTYTVANNGNYIGFQGDGGGGTTLFKNVLVT